MPSTLHTHDLILSLKEIYAEQKLTPQKVYDMLEAAGYHVSINSIKRVFAPGSEEEHFRFHGTVQPIARILLGIYGNEKENPETDALRADIRVKAELIEKLEREILDMKTETSRRSEFLMRQIELKDQRIDRLMTRVDEVLSINKDLLVQIQRFLERV